METVTESHTVYHPNGNLMQVIERTYNTSKTLICEKYKVNGLLHRLQAFDTPEEDCEWWEASSEPTVSHDDDQVCLWYYQDLLHRRDLPAIEYADGTIKYYKYGVLHNENGAAAYFSNGIREYFIEGIFIKKKGETTHLPTTDGMMIEDCSAGVVRDLEWNMERELETIDLVGLKI